mgnify:CR=1 FL=1
MYLAFGNSKKMGLNFDKSEKYYQLRYQINLLWDQV